MFSLFIVLATASATDRVATPLSSLPETTPEAVTEETPAPPEAPAAVAAIRPLLGARHTADLPDKAALSLHDDAEAALHWLTLYGQTLIEAERAAMLLAAYDTPATAAVCVELLAGPAHAKLRAGAARCLASQSTTEAVEPTLVAALRDPDVRVGVAAADALHQRPGAVDRLDRSQLDPLPEVVQAHLEGR
jgi:hypothetical protein